MDFEEYKAGVLATESLLPSDHPVPSILLYHLFKSIENLSDALDLVKKSVFYGQAIDPQLVVDKIKESDYQNYLVRDTVDGHVSLEPCGNLGKSTVTNIRLLHSLVGCVGEAGELAKVGSEMVSPGHYTPINAVNILEEFGDFAYYETVGLDALGLTRDQRDIANNRKLAKRYPAGFSAEKAVNRDLGAEKDILYDVYDTAMAPRDKSFQEGLEKMGIEVEIKEYQ